MRELHELKDRLMRELKEYGKISDMSAGTLEVVDKLTHTLKNLCKIIDREDDYYNEMSYQRGKSVSRMTEKLYELMDMTSDDQTKNDIRKLIDKVSQ